MNRAKTILSLMLVGCTVISLASFGQDLDGRDAAPQKAGPRVRENLITLKLLRMTQALDLTTDQTSAIYPVVTRLETEKYGVTQKLNEAMKDLSLQVEQAKPDDARILGLLADIEGWRGRIIAIDKETSDFLTAKLSVVQRAKYLLFNAEFYRRLGERLGHLRQGRLKNRFTN